MAKRFLKPTVNWKELAARINPEEQARFLAFQGKSNVYLQRVNSFPPEPPKMNWEEYKKMVPVPGLVDKLKSAYESFKVPYPQDTMSAKVDEEWSTLKGEIEKYKAELQAMIEGAMKARDKVNALPKLEQMTMETYFDMYPDEALNPVNKPTFWPHTPEEQELRSIESHH